MLLYIKELSMSLLRTFSNNFLTLSTICLPHFPAMKLLLSPFFTVFFSALVTVVGHYNLKHPAPYNDFQCSPASKNDPICGPGCPTILSSGIQKAHNTPATPSAVWRRGQNVTIEWHRNNHEGGFYRRSLVPVDNMFDISWHARTAFGWGCWSQGTFLCGGLPASGSCGTDLRGLAYSNNMTVPAVFPDGDYVFAMVWYGGIDLPKRVTFFPDYYTCAFVRIEGGPL